MDIASWSETLASDAGWVQPCLVASRAAQRYGDSTDQKHRMRDRVPVMSYADDAALVDTDSG